MRQLAAAVPDDQPSTSVDFSDSCDNVGDDQRARMRPPPIFCSESEATNDDHPFTPTSGAASPPSTSTLNANGTRLNLAPDNANRDQIPSPSGSGGKLRTPSQSSCLSSPSVTSQTLRSPKRVSFLVSEAEKDDKAERRPLREPGHSLGGTYGDDALAPDKSVKSETCCCAMM
uniref:Uncharacterized protein n=1 Tax=Plectus sambesii TaxID=2011161 RepID=A0A914VJ55_9BILA